MSKKTFYVTTPIYYPSAKLHIGHAYTTTLADVLKRYKKLQGYDTYFLTGSDEHGQKIEKKAEEQNISPLAFVDNIVAKFKDLWTQLGIDYDQFIRTTDPKHEKAVQIIFSTLLQNGDIYKGSYKGVYCVSCEEFLTTAQINKETNRCLICNNVPSELSEETYYFRVSKYADFLLDYFAEHPQFLTPISSRREMENNFIKPGLTDLSVTRTTFTWGIPILEDNKHIIYVWIDALSNYITALGYNSADDALFKKFWGEETEIVQLIGKEIARFHTIYWPAILKSLNLRLPNRIISHGWILFKNTKMSKSLGNVVDPLFLIEHYSRDVLRFFLASEIPTDKDGVYSNEIFLEAYNTHLVNNIGNLVSRVTNMIEKYNNKILSTEIDSSNDQLVSFTKQAIRDYVVAMDNYEISKAINIAVGIGQEANKYIEVMKPWEMAKNEQTAELNQLMASLSYAVVVIAYLLQPVIIDGAQKILSQFSLDVKNLSFEKILDETIVLNRTISKADILYPRLKIDAELAKMEQMFQ